MCCELCNNSDSRVLRTTEKDNGDVRRTRQCTRCGHRWATVEMAESEVLRMHKVRQAADALVDAIRQA